MYPPPSPVREEERRKIIIWVSSILCRLPFDFRVRMECSPLEHVLLQMFMSGMAVGIDQRKTPFSVINPTGKMCKNKYVFMDLI